MTTTPLLDQLEETTAAAGRFVALPLEDGSYFQLRHLPWDAVAELEQSAGVSWLLIIDAPQTHGRVLAELARLVAIANDEEPPKIDTVQDLIDISDRLVVVDGLGRRVAEQPDVQPDRVAWTAE